MKHQSKAITILSVLCILAILFNVLHNTYSDNNIDDPFKGAPAHVIWKDQTGKTDTMLLSGHIENIQ
jgi:hypothetical protein